MKGCCQVHAFATFYEYSLQSLLQLPMEVVMPSNRMPPSSNYVSSPNFTLHYLFTQITFVNRLYENTSVVIRKLHSQHVLLRLMTRALRGVETGV